MDPIYAVLRKHWHAASCLLPLAKIHTSNDMLDRIKPAVLTLLHTILRIKMTSSWIPVVLPPCSEPILTYCQRLAAMKKGDGITQLKRWRVQSARAYKSRAASRHEYVSVTVVDPHNKTTYVAIERLRGADPDPGPIPSDSISDPNFDPQPLGLSDSSSISSFSSVSDFISPSCPVDDRIAPMPPSGMWSESDELVCELIFEKSLYLYELAILALIVHDLNPSYLLMTNNCYYYAGTIMKILEEAYNIANTAEGASAGKWCGLVIYRKEGNFSSLLEKFKQGIKNFVRFIPIIPY